MNEEEAQDKKKRARSRPKTSKESRFGRINVAKYFLYEKERDNNQNEFPSYNQISVKIKGKKPNYKICNVCFNFANYTCPKCFDKYCSIDCFKVHTEVKCVKYLDI
jgi:hypothetical protein